MIKFIRELVAVPLRLVLFVCDILPIFNKAVIAKAIWKITAEPDDAVSYLNFTAKQFDADRVRLLAEELLIATNDAKVAAYIASYEYQNREYEKANGWVVKANELECANLERLLYIRLLLNWSSVEERLKLIDEIISRNDLPMDHSAFAYSMKCWNLLDIDFGSARKLSEKVLSIKEDMWARLTLWVVEECDGKSNVADNHLATAKKLSKKDGMRDSYFSFIVADGKLLQDRREEACEYLYEAEQELKKFPYDPDSSLRQLMMSDMYKEYSQKRKSEELV